MRRFRAGAHDLNDFFLPERSDSTSRHMTSRHIM
jgi:hypothetical protein